MSANEKLGITVEATDLASGKLSKVKAEVAGIGAAGKASSLGFGGFVGGVEKGATRMKTAIAGAVTHAKARLSSLGSAATSLLGVGGIFAGFAIIGKSVQEAANFGANVQIVAKATGLAIPVASAMVDTLDKWGVSSDRLIPMLGKLEKNLGGIAAKKGGLAAFRKEFGLSLTDNRGKLVDANTLLLRSADYFNSNATASQKALVMSKLWGKNWQDMIPVLSKGSAGIKEQEKNSIKLTQTQLDNITKYRNASREFQDTIGDIEVKIGANLMPLLTRGMSAVSGWLDSHGDEIASFFGNAADLAGTAASGAIAMFDAVKTGWGTIPGPLRDLLIKGFAADRLIKFAFGFSPISLALKVGTDVVGGVAKAVGSSVAGSLVGSKLLVQHVWVDNMGVGGMGGAGGAAGAAGGMGLLAGSIVLGVVAAAEVGIAELIRQKLHPTTSGELYQRDNFTVAEQAAYHGGKSVEDINAAREAVNAAADRAHDDAEKVSMAIKTGFGKDVVGGLDKVDQAIRSRKQPVTVPVRVSVKDYATTHVRVFENGNAVSNTSSSASSSSDSRFAGYTRGLASGGRLDPNVPTLVGEHGPELAFRGWITDANRTQRLLRSAYGGGPGAALGGGGSAAAAIDRVAARFEAVLDRSVRLPRPAYVTARQAEGATARQAAYGPTRARQLSFAG